MESSKYLLTAIVEELNCEKLIWLERPIDFPVTRQEDADELFFELNRKVSQALDNRHSVALREYTLIMDAAHILVEQGFKIPKNCSYIDKFFG